jgi:FKBP-type peptidyl-prolyl cis-trans isomerase
MYRLSVFIISCVFVAGCSSQKGDDYTEIDGGLKYKIHIDEEGTAAQDGDVIIAHQIVQTQQDSTLSNKKSKKIPVTKDVPLFKIFSKLSAGDSVAILESTDSIMGQSDYKEWPDYIKNNDYLKRNISVSEITTKEKAAQMTPKDRSARTKKEVKKIKSYLESKDWEAQSTASGLHYIIEKEGTGPQPGAEDEVKLHYEGKVLEGPDYASTKEQGKPIEFKVKHLFPGLKEGVMLLKEGAKAKLFLPSALAFGEKGNEKVPPNSIMVFDVHLLEVNKSASTTS